MVKAVQALVLGPRLITLWPPAAGEPRSRPPQPCSTLKTTPATAVPLTMRAHAGLDPHMPPTVKPLHKRCAATLAAQERACGAGALLARTASKRCWIVDHGGQPARSDGDFA